VTITIKNLGNGQLPSSAGDLYEVPASTQAIVSGITLYNTNTTTESITIYYLESGGTARVLVTWPLPTTATFIFDSPKLTLGSGDRIRGVTTTASKVDFTISGVEIS
jgi:hypothetical protein